MEMQVLPVLKKPLHEFEEFSNYHPNSNLAFLGKITENSNHQAPCAIRQHPGCLTIRVRPGPHTRMALVALKDGLLVAIGRGQISV